MSKSTNDRNLSHIINIDLSLLEVGLHIHFFLIMQFLLNVTLSLLSRTFKFRYMKVELKDLHRLIQHFNKSSSIL